MLLENDSNFLNLNYAKSSGVTKNVLLTSIWLQKNNENSKRNTNNVQVVSAWFQTFTTFMAHYWDIKKSMLYLIC